MRIRDEDLRAIARLWRELSEFPASCAEEALAHCFSRLGRIIGADNLFWVGATRDREEPRIREPQFGEPEANNLSGSDCNAGDVLHGWRPKAVRHLHRDPHRDRIVADVLRQMQANIVDPHTQALVAGAGTTRAYLRPELVDDETWEQSWVVNEAMRPIGTEDRIVGARAVDGRNESYIGLDRRRGERPFGERERDLLYLFLLGCPGFHREQLLLRGLADPPITPREQDVLRLLLTDLSEREIGEALGLTWRTTHQYVGTILKKFGVKGRVGLMAYWLRHRGRGRS
jgi:DNA-binding CsgD family transcriptional regulator